MLFLLTTKTSYLVQHLSALELFCFFQLFGIIANDTTANTFLDFCLPGLQPLTPLLLFKGLQHIQGNKHGKT